MVIRLLIGLASIAVGMLIVVAIHRASEPGSLLERLRMRGGW